VSFARHDDTPIRKVAPLMSLLVVGCNHRSAELGVLERLAVPTDDLPKALDDLRSLEHVTEAAVLSTCNRVEVYASVTRFHPGLSEVRGWLAERADVHPQDLEDLHYGYHDDRAAAHLFAVAGGLDSMVVGERQIGLQVRQAGELARTHGAAGRVLQRVFRQAVEVGRRLRRETDLDSGASSMVDVGLEAARRYLPAEPVRVAIVGAGKIGALTAARVDDSWVSHVDVWNRSADKAARLAARLGERARPVGTLEDALAGADLVICTTGAPEPVIDATLVERARGGRAVVLLDLAVPRNVEPACAELAGVRVVDIATVRDVADRRVTGDVLAAAWRIVDHEAERFAAWTRGSQVEPTVRDLRQRAEEIRRAEVERLAGRLVGLDARQQAAVDALTRGLVNTLLHEPTVRLKDLAARGGGEAHADALRDLFDLDE
jgi:glutamyl-tRNA reductase